MRDFTIPRLPCLEAGSAWSTARPRDHPDLSDLEAVTDCRAATRASHRQGRDRLEKLRCVLFWLPFFWSSSVLRLPMPQRCIIPSRGMSSSVPSEMSTRAFRRCCRTRPPATTIHPSSVAADRRTALTFCSGRCKEFLRPIQFDQLLSVDQPEPVAHRSHEVAVM
jgi:hypothetical protein